METIAMAVLWVLANAVYVDMRRTGQRGFKRLCAFWLGWPGTLVGMLSVDEGSQPTVRMDDRDLESLVRDIRRDRLGRGTDGPVDERAGGSTGGRVGGGALDGEAGDVPEGAG